MAYTCNLSTGEAEAAKIISARPAWATEILTEKKERVLGHSVLQWGWGEVNRVLTQQPLTHAY